MLSDPVYHKNLIITITLAVIVIAIEGSDS
jgi:hypothetical protein